MASPPPLQVGAEVSVRNVSCHIRYVGSTHFADGTWVGVEFPSKIGRNDGSVEDKRYFDCEPRHGLFVRPESVQPLDQAAARQTRDAPEDHVSAWATMENVLEAEAIQAGLAGDRVLRHLRQLHPKGDGEPASPSRRKSKHRQGEDGKGKKPIGASMKREVEEVSTAPLDSPGSSDLVTRLQGRYHALPPGYTGPTFEGGVTPEGMAALLRHIKTQVVQHGSARPPAPAAPAVPGKVAVELLQGARRWLDQTSSSLIELPLTEGRIVVVGDTHGQLNDFCWILKAHGPPSAGNVYLINGDVADRGGYAVEIYLLLFGYMLACPGCVHVNRGNHESFDMNIRYTLSILPLAATLSVLPLATLPASVSPRTSFLAAPPPHLT